MTAAPPSEAGVLGRLARPGPAGRALASALCVLLAWVPWARSWADAMRAQGLAGQAEGRALAGAVATPAVGAGTLTLFPDTGRALTLPLDALFPGAGAGTAEGLSTHYDDPAGLAARAGAAREGLASEASASGEAYRALAAGVDRPRPDMALDPLWSQTDQVLTDFERLAASFADCTGTSTFREGRRQVYLPDYRTCERISRPTVMSCSATRSYAVETRAADAYLGVWGRNVNTFEFDLKSGSYRLIEPSDADTWQECESGEDGVCTWTTYLGGSVSALGEGFCDAGAWKSRLVGVWDWTGGPGPGKYDASYFHRELQLPSCATDLVGRVQLDDNGGSHWYRYGAHWQFQFQRLSRDRWGWSNPACPDLISRIGDGFCTGSVTCTGNPGSHCLTVDGATWCGGELAAPPVAGVPRGCTEIQVGADCAFNVGAMSCWTDPQGVTRCPQNTGRIATDCTALEADPGCGFIKSRCVEGAKGSAGDCYVWEETYDCGRLEDLPVLERLAAMDCAGPVRCLGADCLALAPESSTDFARAAAALQAAQLMAMDSDCAMTDQGGTHGAVHGCTVFAGEDLECKKAVGGLVNCCETPDGVSLADYLSLLLAVGKLDSALMTLGEGHALRGAWETLRAPFTSAWSEVTRSFTSVANNLMGSTAPAASEAAASLSAEAFRQELLHETAGWVAETFGEAAANTLFSAGGNPAVAGGVVDGGALSLGGTVGTALSWVMTAYLVYSVAVILVQLLWRCEEKEFALGAKRELRSCHYVGSYCKSKVVGACIERRQSYCCFASPLSRILQEQMRPQLGRGWGSAKDPDCAGVGVEQLARIDWGRVNLDEWLVILDRTGLLPSVATLSLEALTGAGSSLSLGASRPGAAERSALRTDGLDADPLRRATELELWGTTLPGVPR